MPKGSGQAASGFWSAFRKLATVFAWVFVTGLGVGIIWGRWVSPNYNSSVGGLYLRQHVLEVAADWNANPKLIPAVTGSANRVTISPPEQFELRFDCGPVAYVFSQPDGTLVKNDAPGGGGDTALPPAHPDYLASLSWAAGSSSLAIPKASARAAEEIARSSGWRVAAKILLIGAGVVSGVAVGYYLGYDNSPSCTDAHFERLLKEPALWKGVAADYVDAVSLTVDGDQRIGDWFDEVPRGGGDSGPARSVRVPKEIWITELMAGRLVLPPLEAVAYSKPPSLWEKNPYAKPVGGKIIDDSPKVKVVTAAGDERIEIDSRHSRLLARRLCTLETFGFHLDSVYSVEHVRRIKELFGIWGGNAPGPSCLQHPWTPRSFRSSEEVRDLIQGKLPGKF